MKVSKRNEEIKELKRKALINASGITFLGFMTTIVGIFLWFLLPLPDLSDSDQKLNLIPKLILAIGVISIIAGVIWIIFILHSKKYK